MHNFVKFYLNHPVYKKSFYKITFLTTTKKNKWTNLNFLSFLAFYRKFEILFDVWSLSNFEIMPKANIFDFSSFHCIFLSSKFGF